MPASSKESLPKMSTPFDPSAKYNPNTDTLTILGTPHYPTVQLSLSPESPPHHESQNPTPFQPHHNPQTKHKTNQTPITNKRAWSHYLAPLAKRLLLDPLQPPGSPVASSKLAKQPRGKSRRSSEGEQSAMRCQRGRDREQGVLKHFNFLQGVATLSKPLKRGYKDAK